MIELNSYISRSSKTAWQVIDEKALIVTPANSTLHMLNSTGTRIWELLENRTKMEDIVNRICSEFEVEEEKASEEVSKFIAELLNKGIVLLEEERQRL